MNYFILYAVIFFSVVLFLFKKANKKKSFYLGKMDDPKEQ